MSIYLKRAYDKPAKSDGQRILVDRMWPRGVSKNQAQIRLWLKDIAPGNALRKWFNHDPDKWREFKARYFRDLASHAEVLQELATKARAGRITLVFAAKNKEFNNAVAIKEYLDKRLRRTRTSRSI